MKKIDYLIICLIIIVSLILLKDLFIPGFYTSHDGIHQIVRLHYFDELIREGQIPPRWVGGLLNGFGYPLFIFSYHFPWFIGETIHLLGLSVIDSVKMTFLVGFFLSGITMYLMQKEMFGRFAGLIGTAIYLLAPYRFSNIFVRAAIGDATIFIFIPILFFALYKLRDKDNLNIKYIVIGALALASTLLSHAMVFFFYAITSLFYITYWFLIKKKASFLVSSFLIFVFGLGISAYYFLPSITERNLTRFSELLSLSGGGVRAYFLTLKEIIYTPWGYGLLHNPEGAMSLQLGITQWLVIFISFVLILLALFKRKNIKTIDIREGIFFLTAVIVSLFLTQKESLPIWAFFEKFAIFDYPWRTLSVAIFSSSVLAGFIVCYFKNEKAKALLGIFLIFLAFYANRNHLRINQTLNWTEDFYLKLDVTSNAYNEYTPKWVRWPTIEKPKPKVEFAFADKINIIKSKSNYLEFILEATGSGNVRINTVYFPGWKLYENNKEIPIEYKSSGFIEFQTTKGTHRISAEFRETPLRLTGDIISLLSISLIGYVLWPRRKKTRSRQP